LTLVTEDTWITETLNSSSLRTDGELLLMDKILLNEINRAIAITSECFANMHFKDGLKACWFEMLNARNDYRTWSKDSNIPMHKDVVRRWAETLVILICPVCPHW
jgi:leucyl-tRNA synthetase